MASRCSKLATIAVLFAVVATSGCATPRPTAPLRAIESGALQRSDTLIVMLPGIGDTAETFFSTGFVDGVADERFDLLAVDATWRYYSSGTVVRRLHEDVVAPARARGYRNIWLLGVSLGGYGSLLYASAFPDEITGVILLSPYLGARRLSERIEQAGGLEAWSGLSRHPERFERGWSSLKNLCASNSPIVILGYGSSDPLAERYGPLLAALEPSHVYVATGGHDWTTWAPLWSRISESVPVPRRHADLRAQASDDNP